MSGFFHFSITFSVFVQGAARGSTFSVLWPRSIPQDILFIHLSVGGRLGAFYFLVITNNDATNICVQFFGVDIFFISLGCILSSEIAWSGGNSNYLRNCQKQPIVQSGSTILPSHQQRMRVAVSLSTFTNT